MTRRILLVLALIAPLVAGLGPAAAAPAMKRVVSEDPVDWTPHILDGAVWAMTTVGDTVIVGGDFTTAKEAHGGPELDRWYLMAFRLSDGAITAFAPWLDGPVYALAPGPGNTVLVGGDFGEVNGVPARSIARLDVATGQVAAGFAASLADGDVRTLARANGSLYVGGKFKNINGTPRAGLARLNIRTGALDPTFDARLEAPDTNRIKVEDIAISPDGRRMVVAGALKGAMGEYRPQLAMFDIGNADVSLADWYSYSYEPKCRKGFNTYLRAVDFSPDGSYFVAVSTGRLSIRGLLCDTAARFETDGPSPHRPTWVNYTGGDSLYAVAVTGSAVYVGGHQRWLNNPRGHETAGPGAVSRPGIAAIHPATGRAMPWNPTRTRGEGVRAFVVTPKGLLVGSDTDRLGHEYHARIGLFPPA